MAEFEPIKDVLREQAEMFFKSRFYELWISRVIEKRRQMSLMLETSPPDTLGRTQGIVQGLLMAMREMRDLYGRDLPYLNKENFPRLGEKIKIEEEREYCLTKTRDWKQFSLRQSKVRKSRGESRKRRSKPPKISSKDMRPFSEKPQVSWTK